MVKKTPAYKNRLKAMELERTGGVTNRKKGGNKHINKYDLPLMNATLFFLWRPYL